MRGAKAIEGGREFLLADGVFYNPEMELCRDLSSLCVGAIGGKQSAIDAMCASGVRGLRYLLENKNVSSLLLCDQSEKAARLARKNAAKAGKKCSVLRADCRKILRSEPFSLIEIDPFGSPVPFLNDAMLSLAANRGGVLSLTATDMAVLCGAHHAACLKNYGSAPLDNEFCHENAARILAGRVALAAAPFGLGARPAFSLSHRHYVKVFFRLEQGAKQAVEAVKSNGFVSYCHGCGWRAASRFPQEKKCPACGHALQVAGPVWLGSLWDKKLVGKMIALNAKRGYGKAAQAEKLLRTIGAEAEISSYGYYDLHALAKKMRVQIMGMEEAIARLEKAGFCASRTHFCPTAVRTDAPHSEIVKMVKK